MITEPKWCQRMNNGGGSWKPTQSKVCVLLPGHPGDCTVSFQLGAFDGIDEAAFEEAQQAEYDWQRDRRWMEVAPRRHCEADLETIDLPAEIRAQLEGWLEGPEATGTLVLMGSVGCGKTWAACAVARSFHFVECDGKRYTNPVVRITSTVDMFRMLRPEGGGKLSMFINPQLLVLDDVGIEKPSDWTEETMFAIFDTRWRECRPTIVTTNLTAPELERHLGTRVYDRLRDDSVALVLPGASRRGVRPAAA